MHFIIPVMHRWLNAEPFCHWLPDIVHFAHKTRKKWTKWRWQRFEWLCSLLSASASSSLAPLPTLLSSLLSLFSFSLPCTFASPLGGTYPFLIESWGVRAANWALREGCRQEIGLPWKRVGFRQCMPFPKPHLQTFVSLQCWGTQRIALFCWFELGWSSREGSKCWSVVMILQHGVMVTAARCCHGNYGMLSNLLAAVLHCLLFLIVKFTYDDPAMIRWDYSQPG